MNQPLFPFISISNDHYPDLIPAENNLSKVAASTLVEDKIPADLLFDNNGYKWTYKQVSEKFKKRFFTIFLAKLFTIPY